MSILFLDDSLERGQTFRQCSPSAEIVTTAAECIDALVRQPWTVVCLDHDLGGEQYVDPALSNTGMEVVRQMCRRKYAVQYVFVHSHNSIAAEQMRQDLSHAGYGWATRRRLP